MRGRGEGRISDVRNGGMGGYERGEAVCVSEVREGG